MTMDSTRLADAFTYAAELHADQLRKDTDIPYISHLMAVAAIVMENGGSENQVIAALLHDGPEDQGGEQTLAEIRRRFGETVATIVEECSDTFEEPKPPWRRRKERYLAHLREASAETLLVSLADKTHNLGSILRDYGEVGEALWGRFRAGREEIGWYYGALLEAFEERAGEVPERLLGEFRGMVRRLERLPT